MKFLVLCSPHIRILVNKYFTNFSSLQSSAVVVRKFNAHQILSPGESEIFIKILDHIQMILVTNNSVNRVPILRKLVGYGPKWKGMLNLIIEMKCDLYIYLYEPGFLQTLLEPTVQSFFDDRENVRIIAPLNLDEMEEIYSFFHTLVKVPVYPLV